MIFENKRFIGKVKLTRLIMLMSLMILVVIVSQVRSIDQISFGLTRFFYVALIALIYIIISVIRYFKHYTYLFYSDDKSQLEIRYYHSVLIGRNYNVVRIPFRELVKYEIKQTWLRKELVLYQKQSDGKISHYKGISVSALDDNELQMILNNIDSYIKA